MANSIEKNAKNNQNTNLNAGKKRIGKAMVGGNSTMQSFVDSEIDNSVVNDAYHLPLG